MKKKQILIAGNGTSNTSVDFRRVPKGIEVFRVTAFFLEDKYYLGKNVDYFLDYYLNLDYVYLTLHHLNKRNEYKINKNNIYVTVTETANEHFPTVIPATPILHKNKAIAEFRRFYEYYYGHYLSTGITAIGLAASLGFEEIYLTGFDFYTNKGQLYPYIPLTPNSCELENTKTTDGGGIYRTIKYKGESNADAAVRNHPTQMQIDFIELIAKEFKRLKLYSVSESPITNLTQAVTIAPVIYKKSYYSPLPKTSDMTTGWLSMPETMPKLRDKTSKI